MKQDVQKTYQRLKNNAAKILSKSDFSKPIHIQVGSASCENAAGANEVAEEFHKHIAASEREDICLRRVGCTGRCSREPIVAIVEDNKKACIYQQVTREKVHEIFISHLLNKTPCKKYMLCSEKESKKIPGQTALQKKLAKMPLTKRFYDLYGNVPFYCKQVRIALRHVGLIDPLSFEEYINNFGFSALASVLSQNDPAAVIEIIKQSNLRGRGGAGFPTGLKWNFARANQSDEKYIICNADEGDPGTFMDRNMLESDPFSIIEGLMIGGFAIGACRGFFYIRAEYPLAVERVEKAISICRKNGLLGKKILNSGFDFDIDVKLGAGAFVCGEETALIHSIEGERGQPRIRPPYPAEKGLFGKPTVINNVETLGNVPFIIEAGADFFKSVGTEKSGGTKVFALTGKAAQTGLIEIPMGTPLREVVETIGGGAAHGRKIKAVQTGGPAGGSIPADLLDTPIDYETLKALGSMMGSGGMIVLDEDDCMVDIAKFFVGFTQDESCGKCTPCREGTKRLLELLERITQGKGDMEDLTKLERLAKLVKHASLCGLGKAAPNPILSTFNRFYDEYVAHVKEKRCPSKKCAALIHYKIDPDKCVGCTACARNCPVSCIAGEVKKVHEIDQSRCIKCGKCFEACRFDAVKKS